MSSNYSAHERIIARFLSSIPIIKKITKKVYQYVCLAMHKKKYTNKSSFLIKQIEFSPVHDSFFGYYDKFPINIDCDHIVYHSTKYPTHKKPNPDVPTEIILQNLYTEKVLLNISSCAYNWQQGCRIQWLNDDLLIFNDFDTVHNKYISRVLSTSLLKEVKTFDHPVQDAYKTDFFLSLNYRRLAVLRPDYGYFNLPPLTKKELRETRNDGIWKIDYATGNSELLVSLDTINTMRFNKKTNNAIHKVNHVMISPTGRQFIFLHRYFIAKRRFDRLILADSATGKLKVLADYGMVSHCFWADEKTILGYLRGPNERNAYWLINTETGDFIPAVDGKLDHYGDGHPHVHGDWFVTDTYPDKARMQHLVLVNWKTGEFKELGEFFHGLNYSGETRCDLHPRFSPDGKSIFFDSVFSGKRKLYKMDVSL